MPKISYNMVVSRKQFVDEAIKSVKNQTFQDWELLILDKENILMGKADDQRIKIFDARNLTSYKCYETLINNSNSDIILHISDDDIDLPHRAQYIYDQMGQTGADIFTCSYLNVDINGAVTNPEIFTNQFDIKTYLFGGMNMPLMTSGYRKSTCPRFRSTFYLLGDYCFFMDSYIRGLKILRSPEVVSHVRNWPGQVSKTSDDKLMRIFWDTERYQYYQTYGVWLNR